MKLIRKRKIRDGGTEEYAYGDRTICRDYRIGTKTEKFFFEGYPKDDLSNLITDKKELSLFWEQLRPKGL